MANHTQKQLDAAKEIVAGAIGLVALLVLVWATYVGRVPFDTALPIIMAILSAAGFGVAGHRKGKRDAKRIDADEIVGVLDDIHTLVDNRPTTDERAIADRVSVLLGNFLGDQQTKTDTSDTPDKPSQRSQTGTPASHPASDTPKTPPADPAESEPVTAIQGIGSGRSSDLSGAGIETVADLASVNVEQLASESGLSSRRIKKWQALARER